MKIAITGIGVISAIGRNCTETLQSLLAEKSGIGAMRHLGSCYKDIPVGEVPFSNEELHRMTGIDEPMPRTSLLGLIAAREALAMAKINGPILNEKMRKCENDWAFINGTTVGGMDLTEQHWKEYQEGKAIENIRLHEAGESTNAIVRHLSITNHQSPITNDETSRFVATPSTACSSALNAIMLGADLLRTGQAKRALVGGAESLSLFHFNGFRTLMILDDQPCRPFDANRNGLNLGEGAGYLVIEPEEEAIARGATILGYINGYANTCDAYHQTASSENGEGAFLAMQSALHMANLQPSDIDYINAHGTATPNNDLSESAALMRLFGDRMPAVSSTKAFTGHTTSASGGLEAVICVLAMQHGFIPANLRWSHNAEGLIKPAIHTEHRPLNNILCNAFGFGGNESSLIISAQGVDLSSVVSRWSLVDGRKSLVDGRWSLVVDQLDDAETGQYVSSAEARRMTMQTRRLVAATRKALQQSGINQPDAIVCATQWGCMMQSMRFLQDMIDSNEQELKPTPFIQSTHNTVASLIAILTGNHGYNCTYSQGTQSLDCALADIQCQMQLGRIRSALVLEFDEQVEAWDNVLSLIGERTHNIAKATLYVNNE